jgi:hypothetical protein
MIKILYKDKEGRNLNCRRLGGKLGVSMKIAHWMLKKNGFRSVKESAKLGLIEERIPKCKEVGKTRANKRDKEGLA